VIIKNHQPNAQGAVVNQPVQIVHTQPADGFAITSLVTGILTILTFWFFPIALVLGVLGLVFGIISYKRRKNGMALAGAICAGIGLVAMALFIIFAIVLADSANDVLRESNRYNYY
jgi:hypothetical protein